MPVTAINRATRKTNAKQLEAADMWLAAAAKKAALTGWARTVKGQQDAAAAILLPFMRAEGLTFFGGVEYEAHSALRFYANEARQFLTGPQLAACQKLVVIEGLRVAPLSISFTDPKGAA